MAIHSLSNRIITARKAKNWTQTDLANALQVNVKNVSRWELDIATPSFEAAINLAVILDISLDFLGGLDKTSNNNPLLTLFNAKADKLTPEQQNALKTILEAF